jgi:hypothetical protein
VPEITTVRPDELRCGRCKQWKPDDQFTRDKSRPERRNRYIYCKTCLAVIQRRSRQRVESRKSNLDRTRYKVSPSPAPGATPTPTALPTSGEITTLREAVRAAYRRHTVAEIRAVVNHECNRLAQKERKPHAERS